MLENRLPGLLLDQDSGIPEQATTFGERAVDVFYVKDVFRLKVSHEAKIEKVRRALLEALEPPAESTVAAE